MSTTIEQLELEVQSNSASAVSGVDKLASSLGRLKSAVKGGVGLTVVVKQLTALNTALNSFSGANADKLNKLSNGLQSLFASGNLKLSSSIATQITNIGTAIRSLDNINFSALSSLGNSLSQLSNVGKTNLSSFISQLQRLPQVVQNLNGVNFRSFSGQIKKLVTALTPLSQMGKNNLTSFVTQLQKLPQAMEALKSVNIKELVAQIRQLANAFAPLSTQMQSIANGFSVLPSKLRGLTQNTNNLTTANEKSALSYAKLASKISIAAVSVKHIASVIAGWIVKSNEYVESLNLFTVSLGEYAGEAQKYGEQVAEIMGIDPAEWLRNQGVFMTLATGFGVVNDRAYTMSKNLTQLGYDLSSFFNISYEDAFQKLQSGVSGELEPLRRLGFDLSVARLQQEALNLGIEKSVNAMTQAEKAELRYYTIMTQVTQAQGDMARTLESPANQLRILKAQIVQLARALGNIFIPILQKVLPYVIAVTQVLRAIADIIAKLFNFELPEFDYSGLNASFSGAADNTDNIADNLGTAAKKAKEIKNAMVGIDELNIIAPDETSPTGGGSVPGNNLGGGLGFELPTYDFIGDATNSKITEIVDKMKEWLGITDDINSWSDLFNTNLGKILIAVGLIGGAFLAWKLSKTFTTAFSVIGSLFGGKKLGGKTGGFSVPSPKTVLKGLADIGLIVLGVIAAVETIGLLMKIPGFEQTARDGINALSTVFQGLGKIILPLTAVSLGIAGLGKIDIATTAKGFAGFSIIVGGVSVLITAIGALLSIPYFSEFLATGVESVKAVFNGLSECALPIGVLSGILIGLGIASPAVILSGLAGFALVIGGIELVLVALGALNQIPGFSWIVGEGGKVLIQLGEILGGFAGSIINGFLGEISNSFPKIGENLAGFMTNAQPFFEGLESVNAEAVDAVKKLAEMVLILTAADVLEGLTSWLTGGNSLVKFGQELEEFAPHLAAYAAEISKAKIDSGAIESSANAAKSMAEFAKNIPNSGGLAGFFAGENDIDVWGEKLVKFGKCFAEYASTVSKAKIDPSVITASSDAAQSIVKFANNIPNEGGVASWFAGDNSIASFGEELVSFGKNFAKYADTVKDVKPDVVTSTSSAASSLTKLADGIPNHGGVVDFFTGSNNIAQFGDDLAIFGSDFRNYYNSVHTIKPDIVEASANAAKSLASLDIPNKGGFFSLFTGEKSITVFGNDLVLFGKQLGQYYKYISVINSGKISSVSNQMTSILEWCKTITNTDGATLTSFGESLRSFGEDFAVCARNIVNGFTDRISSSYTSSKNSVVSWANNVKKWFVSNSYGGVNSQTFGSYAIDIINGFKNKISNYSSIKSKIISWGNSVKNWYVSKSYGAVNYNTFYDYAENVIKGFNNGINIFYSKTREFVKKWTTDIKNTFTHELDEHSPSKVFFQFGVYAIKGFNNAIMAMGTSTKPIVEDWAKSFLKVAPNLQFEVDTSALKYYNGDSFSKSVSANVIHTNNVTVAGFKEAMQEFYNEYMEPTFIQMANDIRRQADKQEKTVVQVGNRTIADVVSNQQKADGYKFIKA